MNSPHHHNNWLLHNKKNLVRQNIDMEGVNHVVALAGNPNTGKSTVFNSLTGLRQHTGNWPGKTVTRAEGSFSYKGKRYKVVDLPGTYSLLSNSTDEEIARNFILFGQPEVTVVITDATRLKRNLNLVLQILEITDRSILCINMIDEAHRNGIEIDESSLSKELGIPVIPTIARQKKGITELIMAIENISSGNYICKPHRIISHSPRLNHAISTIAEKLAEQFPNLPNLNWVALRLLEGDQSIIEAVRTGALGQLSSDKQSVQT